jgi:hypothetical protein
MAIGINYAVTVVLLRETIRDAEEKQGFSGLSQVGMSQICLTGFERCELFSFGQLQLTLLLQYNQLFQFKPSSLGGLLFPLQLHDHLQFLLCFLLR